MRVAKWRMEDAICSGLGSGAAIDQVWGMKKKADGTPLNQAWQLDFPPVRTTRLSFSLTSLVSSFINKRLEYLRGEFYFPRAGRSHHLIPLIRRFVLFKPECGNTFSSRWIHPRAEPRPQNRPTIQDWVDRMLPSISKGVLMRNHHLRIDSFTMGISSAPALLPDTRFQNIKYPLNRNGDMSRHGCHP